MDPRFFRQYLDILNEGPPAGVGPNAPRPTAPQQLGQPDTFTKMLPDMGNKAIDAAQSLVGPYAKAMQDLSINPATKDTAFVKTAPSAVELGASVGQTRQSFNQALAAKPEVGGEVTAKEAKNSAGPDMFRNYLNMLDEQPVTANIDDNTSVTANPTAKTVTAQTKIGDLDLKATRDNSAIPATSMSGDYKVNPNMSIGATHTQTGYKGQMAPTNQVRASYTDTSGSTHNLRADTGVGFGGASGPNVGKNTITTYTKS
jgi:hypothetical protein